MANFNCNKVILGGRLTNSPELKTTQSGVSVCSFTLAISRKYSKDKQETDFINCIAWRQTAEFVSKFFGKGSSLCVTGSIQTRSWQDQNGQKRYATEVIVDEAMFVDSKSEVSANNGTIPPAYGTTTPAYEEVETDEHLPF